MPGPMMMSPSSLDHDALKSTIEGTSVVQKPKKSMLGRIKKKLSKKLGRGKSMTVASPMPQDLAKAEPGVADVDGSQQQNGEDENNAEVVDKEDLNPEQLSGEASPDRDQMDSVLAFNASLPTIESVANESDDEYSNDVKQESKQKSSPSQSGLTTTTMSTKVLLHKMDRRRTRSSRLITRRRKHLAWRTMLNLKVATPVSKVPARKTTTTTRWKFSRTEKGTSPCIHLLASPRMTMKRATKKNSTAMRLTQVRLPSPHRLSSW